jgi:hypothetical protein
MNFSSLHFVAVWIVVFTGAYATGFLVRTLTPGRGAKTTQRPAIKNSQQRHKTTSPNKHLELSRLMLTFPAYHRRNEHEVDSGQYETNGPPNGGRAELKLHRDTRNDNPPRS